MRSSFLILISIILVSCLAVTKPTASKADVNSAPDWITGSSLRHPSSQYLVGVGNSHGQERAKEKARADLVKTIQVKIDASSNLKETVNQRETKGKLDEDIRRTHIEDIRSTSQVEMKNIQIADTWFNPRDEQYYALAVLARSQARSDLLHEMEELDSETSRHISRANALSASNDDIFDRITYMNKAVSSQVHRNILKTYLAAVDTSAARAQTNLYDADSLQAQKLTIQRQIPISVNTEGNNQDSRSLELYAKGGLTISGYIPVSSGNTQYVLDVILDKDQAVHKDNLYWVFANLEIKLRNVLNNKVLGTCSWKLKEASQGENRAAKKVLDEVKNIFDSEFDNVFNAFITAKPCKEQS